MLHDPENTTFAAKNLAGGPSNFLYDCNTFIHRTISYENIIFVVMFIGLTGRSWPCNKEILYDPTFMNNQMIIAKLMKSVLSKWSCFSLTM